MPIEIVPINLNTLGRYIPLLYKSKNIESASFLVVNRLRQFKSAFTISNLASEVNGNYQSADNLAKRRFLPALSRAGIDKIRFHDLRHTYASLLLANGAPMKYVQHQLGHSSITMTMDLYTHLLPEVNDKCVNLLNSIVNQTIEQQEVRRFGT